MSWGCKVSNTHDIGPVNEAIDIQTNNRIADAKKHNRGQRAEEIALAEADKAKSELRKMTISYDTANPTDPATVRRPENSFHIVRMRAHLGGMVEPQQVEIPRKEATLMEMVGERPDECDNSHITALMSKVTIIGDGNTGVDTEYFIDRKLVNCLQDNGQRYGNWEFLVYVVPGTECDKELAADQVAKASVTIRSYHFFLIDARPLISAIQTVEPTPGEIEAGERLFGSDSYVLDTATAMIVSLLEIVCLDRMPILLEAIRFQILAAATDGARAHTLVIGPPGVGKSLIHKVAKMVQPTFKYALPTKVTEAGLIGDGHSNAKQRRPGLLPQAHTGAFSVEDFNQANQVKNQRLCSTFTHVMAEGVVSDASAAKVEYEAQVSIVMDANRKSDVRRTYSGKDGLDRFVEDTGVPTNILSRSTYIAEIPRDTKTQVQVSVEIIKNRDALNATEKAVLKEKIRQLQVYLALMRERHQIVHVPDEVRERIEECLLAACNTTESRFEKHSEFADFMARLSKQMLMLVEAHARMQNRSTAVVGDVEAIFPFIWRKLDWLKSTLFGGQAETQVVDANAKARRMLIKSRMKQWKGATCTPKQVQVRVGLQSASLGTIHADLCELFGEPDGQGEFPVVTVDDGRA